MIDKITEKESIFPTIVEEIKKDRLPLALYGAGLAAKSIYLKLEENGISVDYVVVDSDYLIDNMFLFDKKVTSIGKILSCVDKINVLITFCDNADQIKRYLRAINKINKIFAFDGLCSSHFELSYEQILKNSEGYVYLYNNLEDELSRETLVAFINSRISGKVGFMSSLVKKPQYFPEDIIKLSNQEVVVDCGAYDGDTIIDFLKVSNGNFKKIYAFEPDIKNFKKLKKRFADIDNIGLINKGVWIKQDTLNFSANQGMSSYVSDAGEIEVPVDSIDNVIKENEKVTYIKMDIEGSEFEALRGAERTITSQKPKLAISVYHKADDLLEIPKLIKDLVPEYKMYLRAHHYSSTEVVLYAIAK